MPSLRNTPTEPAAWSAVSMSPATTVPARRSCSASRADHSSTRCSSAPRTSASRATAGSAPPARNSSRTWAATAAKNVSVCSPGSSSAYASERRVCTTLPASRSTAPPSTCSPCARSHIVDASAAVVGKSGVSGVSWR
ncbi:Uncharacterised protein [Mycobacteroides abscessus]|nr:Uncharacterised protein [Mycobacteroides abscessus]